MPVASLRPRRAESQWATIEASIPPLLAEEARLTNAIGLLIGRPSRAVEAKLHAATAETGVAVASFYPDVTLMGSGGTQSLLLGDAFKSHSGFFAIGPSVDIPIFEEGGRLTG